MIMIGLFLFIARLSVKAILCISFVLALLETLVNVQRQL
jgi:hypothetical protein